MSSLADISLRRARLVARAQSDREDIGDGLAPLAGAIRIVDRGLAGARLLRAAVREYPLVAAAAVALALALRPGRTLRLARWAIGAWQAWRLVETALRAR